LQYKGLFIINSILKIQKKIIILLFLILVSVSVFANPDRPKIGLALSGGGAKGIAHVGTLQMLDSLEIPIDYIVGTSIGGIVGALYSVGYSGDDLEYLLEYIDWIELFTDRPKRENVPYLRKKYDGRHQIILGLNGFTPVIPEAMIEGQNVTMLFSRLTLGYDSVQNFDELPIPFRCVATDLLRGKEIILDSGSLAKAMRTTMSIPTVFKPVSWGDSLLVDGGLVNNLPTDVLKDMGPDIIIAVDVGAPLLERKDINSFVDVFQQTYNLLGLQRIEQNKHLADILISPDIKSFSSTDFDPTTIDLLLKKGRAAAAAQLPEFIALKNKLDLFKPEKKFQPGNLPAESIRRIHGIQITGNKELSFSFIYNQIGLNPGDLFSENELENRITQLYALGYFKTIDYHITTVESNKVNVVIKVDEGTKRELRFGFRYDDLHYLVGIASFVGTDLLLPGLRLESDLQFAGLTSFLFKPSLPSRSLDLTIFPFFKYYFWDIPVPIYEISGEKIAKYKDKGNSIGLGFNILLSRSALFEAEYAFEYMNVKPDVAVRDSSRFPEFDDELHTVIFSSTIDMLDNIILPRHGFYFYGKYDYSSKSLGSALDFYRLELNARFYMTFANLHTVMLQGFLGTSEATPMYRRFYLGGPDTFVGLDWMQLVADEMAVARIDYRYEFKNDIFIKLMGNAAFGYKFDGQSPPPGNNIIIGYAIGIQFHSIIGPFEFIYSRGDHSPLNPGPKQYNYYFKAGYIF
jgi:NTE family protein